MYFNWMSQLIHIKLLHLSSQKKNSNFYIAKNTYVYIDIDELNDILSISEHTKFDEAEKIN